MKVKIDFPEDIAQQKAEEARSWQPGEPMRWEAEDLNVPLIIKKVENNMVIKTAHTQVTLSKEELAKIVEASK